MVQLQNERPIQNNEARVRRVDSFFCRRSGGCDRREHMNCDHKWNGDICTECGVLWRVWVEKCQKHPMRKLERELAEANARIEILQSNLDGHAFELTPEIVQARNDQLSALIEPAKRALEYVKGVNADWPIGQDDDRDAVIDALAKALEPFCERQTEENKCSSCANEFATCTAKMIVWGIDRNPSARGSDADKVLECNEYKRKPGCGHMGVNQ
jgi:hypothetical protein